MFEVSASPHIKSAVYTHEIMADVCIALIPAFVFGVYIYGAYAACIAVSYTHLTLPTILRV